MKYAGEPCAGIGSMQAAVRSEKSSSLDKDPSRYAVLVGCNYPTSNSKLHGCVKDVKRMEAILLNRFHFREDHIHLLIDTDPGYAQPTGANIRESLQRMIKNASREDVLLFYYSGYGSRIHSPGSSNTGYHDCIVPSDWDCISDDFFRKLLNEVRVGVSFTIICDCSHGGGLFGKETEQIGPSHIAAPARTTNAASKHRFMDPRPLTISPRRSDHKEKVHSQKGILISGCQEGGRSVEVRREGQNETFGAFSDALHQVLTHHPGPISNKDLVIQARSILNRSNFLQQPCLYCSDVNATAPFLHQSQRSSPPPGPSHQPKQRIPLFKSCGCFTRP